jgi:hypothetical protein
LKPPVQGKPLSVIGIDTEADRNGNPFMIATSLGDVFHPDDFPRCLFTRKYRGKKYVAYNLSYDESAIIKTLPMNIITELWETGKAVYDSYTITVIPKKLLSVSDGRNAIHIYDMLNFYGGSLNKNAEMYLQKKKHDINPRYFYPPIIQRYWYLIAKYCVHDAELVKELADYIIGMFSKLGITPKKLYSTAYVSYQYFRQKCTYVTVRRYWNKYREVLDYAMLSYNGGKFEVTEKGTGEMYEYDIVSAYPHEIANLIDITNARVIHDGKYRKAADYGFYKVRMKIPPELPSPVAVRYGSVNVYPVGEIEKVITKREYEYLIEGGTDVTIESAYHLYCDKKRYPYRKEIYRIMELKAEAKRDNDLLKYHTVKILMNSLYGKFVQLIYDGERWKAGANWNPIYGSIITANCRVRISELQRQYRDIIAVHTDSVISRIPLPFSDSGELGDVIYEVGGNGILLGSGIYQIGDKIKFRGFRIQKVGNGNNKSVQHKIHDDCILFSNDLTDLFSHDTDTVKIFAERPLSWREVAFHGWSRELINCFTDVSKDIHIRFDKKRIWLDDYSSFKEIPLRPVFSTPHIGISFSRNRGSSTGNIML